MGWACGRPRRSSRRPAARPGRWAPTPRTKPRPCRRGREGGRRAPPRGGGAAPRHEDDGGPGRRPGWARIGRDRRRRTGSCRNPPRAGTRRQRHRLGLPRGRSGGPGPSASARMPSEPPVRVAPGRKARTRPPWRPEDPDVPGRCWPPGRDLLDLGRGRGPRPAFSGRLAGGSGSGGPGALEVAGQARVVISSRRRHAASLSKAADPDPGRPGQAGIRVGADGGGIGTQAGR